MARVLAITICWAIVLAGSAWAQPAGTNVPAAFLETWEKTAKNPAKSVSLWQKFAKKNNEHDLGRLANLLAGIQLLRRSDDVADMGKALPYFQFRLPARPPGPDDPQPSHLQKQIDAAGKGLTARVQMLQLGQKLQKYYRKHVEYPRTLDELLAEGSLDAADLIETLAVAPAIMFICGTTMELEAPYSGWEMVGSAVYAAAQNLVVAARSLGLGTTFTTLHLHAESEIRNLLRLPEHVHIRVMLPIGWPDRPFAPVSRRPIEEILHWNHW